MHNGAVILLHPTSKTNADILDEFLTRLENDGYRFGSLYEIAEKSCFSAEKESGVIRAGNPNSMKIARTFDDGPHPKKTDRFLDLLEEHHIRATFFVVGENVLYYPST